MNGPLSTTTVMRTLLRREVVENRLLFLYLPLAGVFMSLFWLALRLANNDLAGQYEQFRRIAVITRPDGAPVVAPERAAEIAAMISQNFVGVITSMSAALMQTAFWASMAFYFLMTLYQQRKDRSILFWNSLPVSDMQSILSKLLAGLVVCQAVYVLSLTALQLLAPIVVWVYSAIAGTQEWDSYLAAAWKYPELWQFVANAVPNTLWGLPMIGWLLLASAWSRRAPFAWATGPLLLIVLVELAIRDESWFLNAAFSHLLPASYFRLSPQTDPLELVIGVLLGVLCVYLAIRLNRSDDT